MLHYITSYVGPINSVYPCSHWQVNIELRVLKGSSRVVLLLSFMFLVVIGTAYLEAQGIWEPFKKRLVAECSSALDAGRVFDLREIVRIDAK